MPRRINRSDRTSITSMALSLRATRIARHSWVNSSSRSGTCDHRGCDPRRSHRTRHDCAAPAAAGCKIRWSARACRAWAAYGGPSAPRVARYARPACCRAPLGRGGVHHARDRGHYRPRQPEGDRALHQSGGSTETGGFGNGENENTQWPTLRKVSQKTQKAVRDQGGFMWRTNRSGLDDGGELGGAIGAHQFAQRHLARSDDAVEGSLYLGVTEVELGLRGIDLRLLEPGARRIAISRCVVERLLRCDLAARELGLPLVFRLRLLQRRLGAGLGGARLLELELVRLGLDDEEGCSFLDLVAVLVIDFLQEALHPRDQVGGVYRRGITGGFEIAGDLLLHRHRHRDLGRRRRHIAVLLPAGAEHERERGCRASDNTRT